METEFNLKIRRDILAFFATMPSGSVKKQQLEFLLDGRRIPQALKNLYLKEVAQMATLVGDFYVLRPNFKNILDSIENQNRQQQLMANAMNAAAQRQSLPAQGPVKGPQKAAAPCETPSQQQQPSPNLPNMQSKPNAPGFQGPVQQSQPAVQHAQQKPPTHQPSLSQSAQKQTLQPEVVIQQAAPKAKSPAPFKVASLPFAAKEMKLANPAQVPPPPAKVTTSAPNTPRAITQTPVPVNVPSASTSAAITSAVHQMLPDNILDLVAAAQSGHLRSLNAAPFRVAQAVPVVKQPTMQAPVSVAQPVPAVKPTMPAPGSVSSSSANNVVVNEPAKKQTAERRKRKASESTKETIQFKYNQLTPVAGTSIRILLYRSQPYVWSEDLCKLAFNVTEVNQENMNFLEEYMGLTKKLPALSVERLELNGPEITFSPPASSKLKSKVFYGAEGLFFLAVHLAHPEMMPSGSGKVSIDVEKILQLCKLLIRGALVINLGSAFNL